MNTGWDFRRTLRPAVVVAALLAAALACASPNPAATLQAVTDTPGPTQGPPQPATATPTQILVLPATGTPLPTVAAGTPGVDCDNTYLPTTEGSTWTYSSTNSLSDTPGGRTVKTTKVTPGSFYHQVQLVQPALTYEVSWLCTAAGLVEYGGGVLAALNASSNVDIDFTANTGVTLPAIIAIGDHWSQATGFVLTSESLNGVGHWIGDYSAVGPEQVTVPAGTFDTMRIDGTLQSISDPYPSMNQTATGSSWYAPEVGLVKASGHFVGEAVDYTYELVLVSYDIK